MKPCWLDAMERSRNSKDLVEFSKRISTKGGGCSYYETRLSNKNQNTKISDVRSMITGSALSFADSTCSTCWNFNTSSRRCHAVGHTPFRRSISFFLTISFFFLPTSLPAQHFFPVNVNSYFLTVCVWILHTSKYLNESIDTDLWCELLMRAFRLSGARLCASMRRRHLQVWSKTRTCGMVCWFYLGNHT